MDVPCRRCGAPTAPTAALPGPMCLACADREAGATAAAIERSARRWRWAAVVAAVAAAAAAAWWWGRLGM